MTVQTEPRDTPAADTRAAAVARTMASIGWPPVLLTLGALAILVWLGRDMTFYHDEFAFLLLRDLSLQGILAPHNEHLSATLVVLYRTLVGTVGTVSYWPYLGVTFALHVIVVGDRVCRRPPRDDGDVGPRRDGRHAGPRLRRRRHPVGVPVRDGRGNRGGHGRGGRRAASAGGRRRSC